MDLEELAELIVYGVLTVAGIALAAWALIALPLWLAPFAFAVITFFGLAALGPVIAVGAFVIAAVLKGFAFLISRRARA